MRDCKQIIHILDLRFLQVTNLSSFIIICHLCMYLCTKVTIISNYRIPLFFYHKSDISINRPSNCEVYMHLLSSVLHAPFNPNPPTTGHMFLCRDVPDHLDCAFLPKLQHVRVVAHAVKNFTIPASLKYVWRYLGNAYDIDVSSRYLRYLRYLYLHYLYLCYF